MISTGHRSWIVVSVINLTDISETRKALSEALIEVEKWIDDGKVDGSPNFSRRFKKQIFKKWRDRSQFFNSSVLNRIDRKYQELGMFTGFLHNSEHHVNKRYRTFNLEI